MIANILSWIIWLTGLIMWIIWLFQLGRYFAREWFGLKMYDITFIEADGTRYENFQSQGRNVTDAQQKALNLQTMDESWKKPVRAVATLQETRSRSGG